MMTETYKERHAAAMLNPQTKEEQIVVSLFRSLTMLADLYEDDYVMAPAIRNTASALIVMENADLGRLDGGLLDKQVRDVVRRAGQNDADLWP